MKPQITTVSLFLLLVHLIFALSLSAQEKVGKSEKATGNVKLVDSEKNYMILVTKEGKLITFDFSSKTKVTKIPGSEKAGIGDIKIGEPTSVSYKMEGARRVATNVEILAHRPGGCPNGQPCPEDEKGKKSAEKKSSEK
jgi:hypothetical protein